MNLSSVFCALAFILTVPGLCYSLRGDSNGNDQLDQDDLSFLKHQILSFIENASTSEIAQDMNGDRFLDASDLVKFQKTTPAIPKVEYPFQALNLPYKGDAIPGYIDNDSLIDFFVVDDESATNEVHLFLNRSGGEFEELPTGTSIKSGPEIFAVEANDDSYTDLLTTDDSSGSYTLYLSSDMGVYAKSYLDIEADSSTIQTRDLNGDGLTDLFSQSENSITIYCSDNGQAFKLRGSAIFENDLKEFDWIDFDNDNDQDIIVYLLDEEKIRLFRQESNLEFFELQALEDYPSDLSDPFLPFENATDIGWMNVGKYNDDEFEDIYYTTETSSSSSWVITTEGIYFGQGDGSFELSRASILGQNEHTNLDLNHDGIEETLMLNNAFLSGHESDSTIAFHFFDDSTTSRTFHFPTPAGFDVNKVQALDVDGDQQIDLYQDRWTVIRRKDEYSFHVPERLTLLNDVALKKADRAPGYAEDPASIYPKYKAMDFNGDGYEDFVTDVDSHVSVFINDKEGNLVPGYNLSFEGCCPLIKTTLGDINNDSLYDAAAILGDQIQVWLSNPSGTHGLIKIPIEYTTLSHHTALADLDGDGFDDFAHIVGTNAKIDIYKGTPNGLSEEKITIENSDTTLHYVGAILATDLDGNGFEDLYILTSDQYNFYTVYPLAFLGSEQMGNFETGIFPDRFDLFGRSLAADLNNDSYPDFTTGIFAYYGEFALSNRDDSYRVMDTDKLVLVIDDLNEDNRLDTLSKIKPEVIEVSLGEADGSFTRLYINNLAGFADIVPITLSPGEKKSLIVYTDFQYYQSAEEAYIYRPIE